MLSLIERRHTCSSLPSLEENEGEKKLNLPFMKMYKSVVSDKIYRYIIKELWGCASLKILSEQ